MLLITNIYNQAAAEMWLLFVIHFIQLKNWQG